MGLQRKTGKCIILSGVQSGDSAKVPQSGKYKEDESRV